MTIEETGVHRDHAEPVPTLTSRRDNEKTVSSSDADIRGRMVKDKDGLELGKIEGLMVDDVAGKVRFMEVAFGGFLGGSKSFIPVDAITRITAYDVYISHTREHVAGAPRYDPGLVADDAHHFFGRRARGKGELISEFAGPFPHQALRASMGWPIADWNRVRGWTHGNQEVAFRQDREAGAILAREFSAYITGTLESRGSGAGRADDLMASYSRP